MILGACATGNLQDINAEFSGLHTRWIFHSVGCVWFYTSRNLYIIQTSALLSLGYAESGNPLITHEQLHRRITGTLSPRYLRQERRYVVAISMYDGHSVLWPDPQLVIKPPQRGDEHHLPKS